MNRRGLALPAPAVLAILPGPARADELFVDKEEEVPLKDHDVEKPILDAIGGSL